MNFLKKHNFLVCIDSDGTAIDSMDIKHKNCFGPCFIKEFELLTIADKAQKLWDDVNLYSLTRGKNRFITLLICLQHLVDAGVPLGNLSALKNWVENSAELSNDSLKKEIEKNPDPILSKTLSWSLATNVAIKGLSIKDVKTFSGVKEFLSYVGDFADVAVVSSANAAAVNSEWQHFELLQYVDAVATQEIGSKKVCIEKMLKKGYDKSKVLMIGDAPPDLDAALTSGVAFYPIITGSEQKSWQDLKDKFFTDFLGGQYNQDYQIKKFENNFNKETDTYNE